MSKLSKKVKSSGENQIPLEENLKSKESEFLLNQVTATESELLANIKIVIEKLDLGQENQGFNSWPIERLISAREKLSRYSETLGEYITIHETKSDFAYIWRKGAYAIDWLPLKDKFPKATISDLEARLDSKYVEEQYYSMFHRRRSDLLIRELEAIDRVIRTIDHRIRELERQWKLEHTPDPIIT